MSRLKVATPNFHVAQLILCDIDCQFQDWIYSFTDFGAKSVTRLSCCRINMGQFAGKSLMLRLHRTEERSALTFVRPRRSW